MTDRHFSAASVAAQARRDGALTLNLHDQHPDAIAFRRAVQRAVKDGLLRREKSPPSRARYVPKEAA